MFAVLIPNIVLEQHTYLDSSGMLLAALGYALLAY